MNDAVITKSLGELTGPILVFGGPYSNLQALTKLKGIALQKGISPTNIICTGDIIGYCAQPEETVRVVKEWGIHFIQGNVEENIIAGEDDCGCNFNERSRCDLFSQNWFPFAARSVSDQTRQWLATIPHRLRFRYAGKTIGVVHGSATNIAEFVFKSTPWEVKAQTFKAMGAEVILAGHSGLPFADSTNGKHWINAGVIGMPANDGTPRVWYLLLDDSTGELTFAFKSFNYDNRQANQLMVEKGLPSSYAQTLLTGIWDNCEILPEAEKQLQGIEIGNEALS